MELPGLIPSLVGTPVLDGTGDLVGRVEDVLVDRSTSAPAWFVVDGRPVPATLLAATAVGYRLRCSWALLGAPGPLADRDAAVALCRRLGVLLPSPGPWTSLRAEVAEPAAPAAGRLVARAYAA